MQRLIPTDIVARLSKLACRKSQKDLHDFRVILHRMESWASLLRNEDLRIEIHQIVKQTNHARDIQVQIEWLNKIGHTEPIPNLQRDLSTFFQKDFPNLKKKLKALKFEPDSRFKNPQNAIQKSWRTLDKQIKKIHGRKDVKLIHKTRLTAKDIRYWLEEINPKTHLIRTQIKHLKTIQNILGDLHDLYRIIKYLKSEKLDSAKIACHKLRNHKKTLFKKFQRLSKEDAE